ncbi:MAG TPA: PQQ-binding-like beta-propeller repeat protein [Candidatus Dormibacteraeota bacterium]|nr:PQQ-binding-like beta-propeller repeat protein [Candidatus Dormibacteraeota bacterium]
MLASVLLSASVSQAADWPQWRGPERNGISSETGLLKEWPKEGPKLLWQSKDIGAGFSTPAVVRDRLYLLSNNGLENEFVAAFSTADGKKVWSKQVGKVGSPQQQPSYPAARSTPTVVGDVLYALGSDGDLVCLETATGEVKWQKNVRTEFGGIAGKWAYAESPLVDGDAVVCTPGGSNTMVALNKKTGDLIWKCNVPGADPAAYSSIIIVQPPSGKQYVQFVEKGLIGVDAKTGKFLWRYDKTAKGSPANIPTPVADDSMIYSATARGGGGLIKLKANDGTFETEQVYFSPKLPTAIGGAVKIGPNLFGTTGQALVCADFAGGQLKWEERSIAPASICSAEERLYLHGENGDVALVETNPQSYSEKGRFTPPDQQDRGAAKAWAYPVVASGRMYIRDTGCLWCYDIKAK